MKGKRLFCLVHIFEIEGLFMEWLLNIKRLKKEKNLTNETLAERSGISLGTINKLFSGASADPKFSTLCALSDAFGVSIDEMMGRKKGEAPELAKTNILLNIWSLARRAECL